MGWDHEALVAASGCAPLLYTLPYLAGAPHDVGSSNRLCAVIYLAYLAGAAQRRRRREAAPFLYTLPGLAGEAQRWLRPRDVGCAPLLLPCLTWQVKHSIS